MTRILFKYIIYPSCERVPKNESVGTLSRHSPSNTSPSSRRVSAKFPGR